MAVNTRNSIVTDGLVGYFDTTNPLSYTSGSTVWKDLTGNANLTLTGSLVNPVYWLGVGEIIPSIATISPNNLLYSNDFTVSAWNKNRTGYTSTITGSAIAPPPGLPGSGSKLNETTVDSKHGIITSCNVAIGQPFRVSFYAKAAERSWLRYENPDWSNFFINFDLVNGVTGSKSVGPATTNGVPFGLYDIAMTNAGDGWWRCSFYIISGYDSFQVGLCSILDNNTPSFVGNPTSGIYIYGVQVEYGLTTGTYVDTSTTASMMTQSAYLEYNGSAIQENNVHSVFVWGKGLISFNGNYNIYSKYSQAGSGSVDMIRTTDLNYIINNTTGTNVSINAIFGNARPLTAYGWFQLGIVKTASQIIYYWNGVRVGAVFRLSASTSSATVKFGSNAGLGPTAAYNSFAGLGFANIMIYNRAVTDQEAMQNFTALQTKYRMISPQTQFGLRTLLSN